MAVVVISAVWTVFKVNQAEQQSAICATHTPQGVAEVLETSKPQPKAEVDGSYLPMPGCGC